MLGVFLELQVVVNGPGLLALGFLAPGLAHQSLVNSGYSQN